MDPVTQTVDGIPVPEDGQPPELPGVEVTEEAPEGQTMVGDAGVSYVAPEPPAEE